MFNKAIRPISSRITPARIGELETRPKIMGWGLIFLIFIGEFFNDVSEVVLDVFYIYTSIGLGRFFSIFNQFKSGFDSVLKLFLLIAVGDSAKIFRALSATACKIFKCCQRRGLKNC
jgi:hypothetical protein